MIIRTSRQLNSISELLESSDILSRLCNHIEQLGKLQIKLHDYLEPPLNEHVIIADYRQKTLVFHADSAAWATKLRYRTPEILKLFRNDLPGIRTIRIKNPPVETREQATRHAARASSETVDTIREVAGRIDDPPLRSALLRIADRLL